ncbi:MAG: hypothetical protein JO071_10225 [Deltaproteobacteria bacterium]|nr:hypothetical protein [Deltaproteobacteria bacterium]
MAGLRAEFDLADHYAAIESKLRSIQEALELVLARRVIVACFCSKWAVLGLILAELIFTALRLL